MCIFATVLERPATESFDYWEKLGRKTYWYYYTGNLSDISPRYWEGVYHASELLMAFGTYDQFRGEGTEFEKETVRRCRFFGYRSRRIQVLRENGRSMGPRMLVFAREGHSPNSL